MIFPVVNAASFFLGIFAALPLSIYNLVLISWVFGAVCFIAHLFRG